MPKIKEYDPSLAKLAPNGQALQAWETAGRRVGPLYNQAGQDLREAGRVQGDMERAKIWPFDIYQLEASNAPQVKETSSTETNIRPGSGGGGGGHGGGRERSSWDNPPVNPTTTPEAIADRQIAISEGATAQDGADYTWGQAHGEASAGAVGMSQLARAASSGGLSINPNSDLPVDWKTNSNYNGDSLVDTPNGQFTPHQMDRFSKQYMDTWDKNMAKWERQQDAYWNGPNGWNTMRDKWVNGMEDQFQKGYDADQKAMDKTVNGYLKKNPGADRDELMRDEYERRHVFSTSSGQDVGGGSFGPPPPSGPGYTGSGHGIVDSVAGAFRGMFGSDEPAATADIPND